MVKIVTLKISDMAYEDLMTLQRHSSECLLDFVSDAIIEYADRFFNEYRCDDKGKGEKRRASRSKSSRVTSMVNDGVDDPPVLTDDDFDNILDQLRLELLNLHKILKDED